MVNGEKIMFSNLEYLCNICMDWCFGDKIKMSNNSIHDKGVRTIEERLKGNHYNTVKTEKVFRVGSITWSPDVYAINHTKNKDYLLLFEFKSNNREKWRHKAYKQLDTSERMMSQLVDKVYKFYVTPDKLEWYRK